MSSFAKNLELALSRSGMTQVQLADKVNLSPVTINRYLSGQRQPKVETMAVLADALKVSTEYLVRGEREPAIHVEMIIDYIVEDSEFKYNDNHGILIRCKECAYSIPDSHACSMIGIKSGYCGRAVRK